jgi:integrase
MPARDSRNRRIAGLATRNGRFYGVLWADRGDGTKGTRRFPLLDGDGVPIRTLTAAKDAFDALRNSRRENALPQPGHKPSFDTFAAEYLAMAVTQRKKPGTLENETQSIARWRAHLGTVRIDRIATPAIKRFMEIRLSGCTLGGRKFGVAAPRTVKLDLVVLRNVLKTAAEAGHVRDIPRFPKIAVPPPPRRPLLSPAEFERLLAACLATKATGSPVTKNGEQLRDFLRLLAYTGARETEALRLKWAHVDFAGRRIFIGASDDFTAAAMTIGTGGDSKNRGSRGVDFNPQLENLLREMHGRRAPDSSFVFPSPQRGERDIPAKSLRESLRRARADAELPTVGFHDLRHLFCSFAVMAGIDFMTIAGWLGHKDGGILIGKVYGHLLDEHRQKMAARLTIVPLADSAQITNGTK